MREFSLAALDDDNGISSEAWELLIPLLEENGDNDIIEMVEVCSGRAYLPADAAEILYDEGDNEND